LLLLVLLAVPALAQQVDSPPTIWAPIPAQPAISASGPPISAGPVVVANGHLSVAGQRALFPACNWDNWAVLGLVGLSGGKETGTLNPTYQTFVQQHLNNVSAQGFRAIRIHGLDTFSGGNLFSIPTNTTTLSLDPNALQALAWFINQARTQRNLRVAITVHYNRQLTTQDAATITANNGGTAPAGLNETMANGYLACGPGGLWPWKLPPLGFTWTQQLEIAYEQQLFSYVSPYDNVPLGQLIDFLITENEHSWGKEIPWGGFGNGTEFPALTAAYASAWNAWLSANNITTPNAVNRAQFAAYCDVQLAQAEYTRLKVLCPNALIITSTYFGNAPYPMLAGMMVGDIMDCHCYSRGAATDTNGFLSGRVGVTPADPRSRFAAILAGCSVSPASAAAAGTAGANTTSAGKPQSCTEWAGVGQYGGGTLDPPSEQAQDLGAAYQAAITQDVDFIALYSYASTVIQGEGSPYWKPSVYDQRINAPLLSGAQWWNAQFTNLAARNAPTVTVTKTSGTFGSYSATGAYSLYGPFTDPALYAVPANQKVLLTP